jgi:hypothetical protein
MKQVCVKVAFVIALAFATGAASAAVLASETFNYPTGSVLNNQNGGTGWGTNLWVATDGSGWTNTSPGLAAAGVTSPDNCAKSATSSSGTRTATRKLSFTNSVGVIYLGVLLRYDTGGGENGYVQMSGDYNRNPFRINWGVNGTWGVSGMSGTAGTFNATVSSGIAVVAGQPVLAVLKMDLGAKTAALFINQATEGTPNATATSTTWSAFHTITVRSASGGATMDDLRLGTSYADVAVIPKPKVTVLTVR